MKKEAKGHCPPSGCIKQDSSGKWRIISNKDGHTWPQHYDSRDKAESALAAYHAHQGSALNSIRTAKQSIHTAQTLMSLKAIERELERMEAKGLGDTEEYRLLDEEANKIVERRNKAEDESKAQELLQQQEQMKMQQTQELEERERALAEKIQKRKERIEKDWQEISESDFFQAVLTNYPITVEDGQYIVTSKVKNKKWVVPDELTAKEKVLDLCEWRAYDKFDRPEDSDRGRVKKNPTKFTASLKAAREAVWKASKHKSE